MLTLLTDRRPFGPKLTERLSAYGLTVLTERTTAAQLLCERHDLGALVIDGTEDPSAAASLCVRLRTAHPELPIALLLGRDGTVDLAADGILRGETVEEVAEEILRFCRAHGWSSELSTYALSVSERPEQTRLLGYPLPLSPREHRVLRLLFLRAPQTVTRLELLAVCFPEGSQREQDLTVHVNRINKKAHRITELPLIECVYGKGYRLRAGIVRPEQKP